MGRTITRTERRERDGYTVHRDHRPVARRLTTRNAIIRAELSRDMPAVRKALKAS